MGVHRFYIDPTPTYPLVVGARVALPEEEAHHARTVLRVRDGEEVALFDGAGVMADACVISVGRRDTMVEIRAVRQVPRARLHVTIAFAPPKGKRTLQTVEALTELGVDALVPLQTARSVAEGGSREKWRQKMIEACKQCGRAYLPEVGDTCGVETFAATASGYDGMYVASLTPEALSAEMLVDRFRSANRVAWCIGPEGGWTDEEEALLMQAGAQPVRIAPHVLRIGTAAELCAGLTRFLANA